MEIRASRQRRRHVQPSLIIGIKMVKQVKLETLWTLTVSLGLHNIPRPEYRTALEMVKSHCRLGVKKRLVFMLCCINVTSVALIIIGTL